MELCVVIVNYNVRYFLEQCLLSVERAVEGLEAEVWVVDNASRDGSVAMVRERFPWVRVVANRNNPGFSTANNQVLRASRGTAGGAKWFLLLNPDTIVAEDTFRKVLAFANAQPDAGGVGVRMIDGSGRFLPESKRGLPTPWVAFTKAFGLARLFPNSRRFGHYHLGYLDEHDTHRVEVLAGAFMLLKGEALDRVGLLDEIFFMYGEDIDLSYRITQGGYANYYFPDAPIVHYKGESTKRGSLNYVRVFYQAMIIFARKHFVGSRATALVLIMQGAVYFRAVLTIFGNLWQRLRLPLLDGIGFYLGLRVAKHAWATYHFADPDHFAAKLNYVDFPAYAIFWLTSIFLSGGYDKPYDLGRLIRSLAIGSLFLLAVYGLLPETLRPSRALLLIGSAWALLWSLGVRYATHLLAYGNVQLSSNDGRRLLLVGSEAEARRALSLLQRAGARRDFLDRLDPHRLADLPRLAPTFRAEELLFCTADLPYTCVLQLIDQLGPNYEYRLLPAGSDSLIGSHRSDRRGNLYTIDANQRINDPTRRRGKWIFDKVVALLLLLFPNLFKPAWQVLTGRRSWVGYHPGDPDVKRLPQLRPGVFYPGVGEQDPEIVRRLNALYARDYSVGMDWELLREGMRDVKSKM